MFDRILIANRGEIACRVMETARRLGIRTIAVYSDADAGARHVAMADEAHHVGGARAQESYLDIARLIAVANQAGAAAVHPGYGFLSENADFAEACAAAGIAFIGPQPAAIRAMGSKSEAKRLMETAGVPLLPGYHGDDQSEETMAAAAEEIGYPVMIKAAAGGGGRGMRIIEAADDLADGLAGARREAKAGFGDDTLLLEKYLPSARHVEMQVFGDTQGNLVHLFERDCSIQRRHQKIIEEAPAPGMTDAMRGAMAAAALSAAGAIDYVGAGTVEFLVEAARMGEADCFYFMEMNTRLQVEHPVTEMITGVDLVEWQIRVADGESLPLQQSEIELSGHAIEARFYAEDPARDFRPSPGPLSYFRPPAENAHIRLDTGVREGDEVSVHYDPMIAKIVGWDHDRDGAIQRLGQALDQTHLVGTTSNLDFLAAAVSSEAFAAGDLDTAFVERHRQALFPAAGPAEPRMIALAALADLLWQAEAAAAVAAASGDPYSPWHRIDGWRLDERSHTEFRYLDGEDEIVVEAHPTDDGYLLQIGEARLTARGHFQPDGRLAAEIDGHHVAVSIVRHLTERHLLTAQGTRRLDLVDPLAARALGQGSGGRLTAPLPGRVVSVAVAVGDKVRPGDALMVLEAMKMEHTISAPIEGVVAAIHFGEGEQVDEGAELIALESGSD